MSKTAHNTLYIWLPYAFYAYEGISHHVFLVQDIPDFLQDLHPDGVQDPVKVGTPEVCVEGHQVAVKVVHQLPNGLVTSQSGRDR